VVVLGHLSLTFENLDIDSWLVILIGGESLGLLGWNSGVSVDDVGHHSSSSFDTHGKWGNIEKKKLLSLLITLSSEDGSLDSSSVSNSLIRVDGFVKSLSVEEIGKHGLNFWDSC